MKKGIITFDDGTKMYEKDMVAYCCRTGCGQELHIGDSIKYDKNYDTYCNSDWCSDGIATWTTCLEPCWWG